MYVIVNDSEASDYGNDDIDRYGHDQRDGDGVASGDKKNVCCVNPYSGRYHACLFLCFC